MIDQDVGFLLYLTWMDVPESVEDEDKETSLEYEKVSEAAAMTPIDIDEEGVHLEPDEERALVEKFNIAFFKAESITKVEDEEEDSLEGWEEQFKDLACLPLFPTYLFNEREYVLLGDIQWLFDLREDYCLACLARWGELDNNFIDSSPYPIVVLDTKGANFMEKQEKIIVYVYDRYIVIIM